MPALLCWLEGRRCCWGFCFPVTIHGGVRCRWRIVYPATAYYFFRLLLFVGCIWCFHLLSGMPHASCFAAVLLTKLLCASRYATVCCYLPSEHTFCKRGCLAGLRVPPLWIAAGAGFIKKADNIVSTSQRLSCFILKLPYLILSEIIQTIRI